MGIGETSFNNHFILLAGARPVILTGASQKAIRVVTIGSDNDLVSPESKPLPELMLTHVYHTAPTTLIRRNITTSNV